MYGLIANVIVSENFVISALEGLELVFEELLALSRKKSDETQQGWPPGAPPGSATVNVEHSACPDLVAELTSGLFCHMLYALRLQ